MPFYFLERRLSKIDQAVFILLKSDILAFKGPDYIGPVFSKRDQEGVSLESSSQTPVYIGMAKISLHPHQSLAPGAALEM